MICTVCDAICERTSPNQNRCPDCSKENKKKLDRAEYLKRKKNGYFKKRKIQND